MTHTTRDQSDRLILSWNVAGWTSAAAIIRSFYNGRISSFLDEILAPPGDAPIVPDVGNLRFPTGSDVALIALQEVKGSWARLKQDPKAAGAQDDARGAQTIAGWETYWAHAHQRHRGFNGVAIFARANVVKYADPAPLRDPEMDDEGRCMCVVTEACAVFSVYAPNSRGGSRDAHRQKFFDLLVSAVNRVRREYGVPVVVCGDLNATYRAVDCHWSVRRINVPALRAEVARSDAAPEYRRHMQELLTEVEARLALENGSSGNVDYNTSQGAGPENIWVDSFLTSDVYTARSRRWFDLVRAGTIFSLPTHVDGPSTVGRLMDQCGLVDTYRIMNASATGMFTVYNQMLNSRYRNAGTRIDFILTDPCLFSGDYPADVMPRSDVPIVEHPEWCTSAEFAEGVRFATLRGQFQPAPMEGTGLAPTTRAACTAAVSTAAARGSVRAGLLYTPPQLSDHLGVYAAVSWEPRLKAVPPELETVSIAATRKCKFTPATPSILSFFKPKVAAVESQPLVAVAAAPTRRERDDEVIID